MARYAKSQLAEAAKERLSKFRQNEQRLIKDESILDFIVRNAPPSFDGMQPVRPNHFAPVEDALNRIIHVGKEFVCVSAPPRHGKSTTCCFYLIAMYLLAHPDHKVLYACYSAKLAENRNRNEIRPVCERVGVELDRNNRAAGAWRTKQGGGVWALGIEGAATGFGFNLIVIDDPYRDRAEAESPTIKNNVIDWFSSTSNSRLQPGGSILITHTRWAVDDLTGYVTELPRSPFLYYNFPAINQNGEPLWPEVWPLEELNRKRAAGVTDYDWASLYLGEPRPRGMSVFNGAEFYTADDLEKAGPLRHACGIDLAYTNKNYSDYSSAVLLGKAADGRIFVIDALHMRCTPPQFFERLKGLLGSYDWPPVFAYISGVERGAIELAKREGVKVSFEPAKTDKFSRAQPVATAWNRGQILLPKEAPPWRLDFYRELSNFTGVGDKHDDQVDALAAAYHRFMIPLPARGLGQHRIMPF